MARNNKISFQKLCAWNNFIAIFYGLQICFVRLLLVYSNYCVQLYYEFTFCAIIGFNTIWIAFENICFISFFLY